MISVYNAVTRRPHVPREKGLRRILISQGFDIPLESPPRSGPSSSSLENGGAEGHEPEDMETLEEEEGESESFTDDESVRLELEDDDDESVHLELEDARSGSNFDQ